MNKKKKIAELMNKLEEISKINQSLMLENAEHRARLKTCEEEAAKQEIDEALSEAKNATVQENGGEGASAADVDIDEIANFGEIVDEDLPDGTDDAVSAEDVGFSEINGISVSEVEETAVSDHISSEIDELRLRSDKIEAELASIKELILQTGDGDSAKSVMQTETTNDGSEEKKSDAELSGITQNVGKLIVDAQLGAGRIIDKARADAEAHLQKARQEADMIVSQAEFRSRNIYKSFCDAETEIDQLIIKMEGLSEQIQRAKQALDS